MGSMNYLIDCLWADMIAEYFLSIATHVRQQTNLEVVLLTVYNADLTQQLRTLHANETSRGLLCTQ